MRYAPLLILILLLSACGSTRLTGVTPITLSPQRSYVFGDIQETSVGDPVLRVSRIAGLPTFQPVRDTVTAGLGIQRITYPLDPSQKWIAVAAAPDIGGYIIACTPCVSGDGLGIHVNQDGSIGRGWYDINNSQRPMQGAWPSEPVFEPVDPAPAEGSFSAELVYSGKRGDVINMLYREYTDGSVRPAFTQELSYDLSESDSIRFRSIEIAVEEANSSGITYRVLDDGGLDWLPR